MSAAHVSTPRNVAGTIVLDLIVAFPLVARNLVGITHSDMMGYNYCFAHGWPLIYLDRQMNSAFISGIHFSEMFPWTYGGPDWYCSPLALIVDLAVAIAIFALNWRLLRPWSWSRFRFSLRTLLMVQLVVFLGVVYWSLPIVYADRPAPSIARITYSDGPYAEYGAWLWVMIPFSMSNACAIYSAFKLTGEVPIRMGPLILIERRPYFSWRWFHTARRLLATSLAWVLLCLVLLTRDWADGAILMLGVALFRAFRRKSSIVAGLGVAVAVVSIHALLKAELRYHRIYDDLIEYLFGPIRRDRLEMIVSAASLAAGASYGWWGTWRRNRRLRSKNQPPAVPRPEALPLSESQGLG